MEGRVDLGGWLYNEMVYMYLSTDNHPSNNQARPTATSLI